MFPNPTEGRFSVRSDSAGWFAIYDATGRLIRRPRPLTSGVPLPISAAGWSAGTYFVRFGDEAGRSKVLPLVVVP
ncbi:MAG: T9SS type A sorting domain-containing protein [Catalinimonas sp.]